MTTRVFLDGHVFTADAAGSSASAVAVVDGRIAAVGGTAEVAPFLADADDVVDLGGRMLLPGFVDAHAHPVMGGVERNGCDLSEAPEDLAAYLSIIKAHAELNPRKQWVVGGGWSMSAFPSGLAGRHELDAVTGGRPAYLPNRDHHSAWVSSAALELAGITSQTPDPADGRIERDADGRPSGMLHEGAMTLVERVLPERSQDDLDDGLRTALQYMHSLGVTGWQDAMVPTQLDQPSVHAAYTRAGSEGWLTARVSAALWWERDVTSDDIAAFVERLVAIRDETNARGNDRYGIHSVKVMQDGVAETFTASLLEPYLDSCGCPTDNRGIAFLPKELLLEVVAALDAAAFQVHFHALGDRAVRDVLDAIEHAREKNGSADRRHHLAHLQFVDDAEVSRFRRLDVMANLQALWALREPQMEELTMPFIGAHRGESQYRFGDLLRAGAPLVMGSDWPVSTADPLAAIHVAVNRTHPEHPSAEPLGTDQELTLATALRAYTAGSAYANRRETTTGTVGVGRVADLVVLDADPFDVPVEQLSSIAVDHTYVAGDEVYRAAR